MNLEISGFLKNKLLKSIFFGWKMQTCSKNIYSKINQDIEFIIKKNKYFQWVRVFERSIINK